MATVPRTPPVPHTTIRYHDELRTQHMASQFTTESLILMRKIGLARPVPWRTLAMHLVLLAVFGILLPWLKGVEFMDPALPAIYACLGPLFAAPALVQMLREGDSAWPTTSAR